MRFYNTLHTVLTIGIAAVWLVNGFFCKVLDLVPRHGEIVAHILGELHAGMITVLIGIAEMAMAAWVLSGMKRHLNALVQIVAILLMNVIEVLVVPELLLWGRFNLLFATLFTGLVYYHAFILEKQLKRYQAHAAGA